MSILVAVEVPGGGVVGVVGVDHRVAVVVDSIAQLDGTGVNQGVGVIAVDVGGVAVGVGIGWAGVDLAGVTSVDVCVHVTGVEGVVAWVRACCERERTEDQHGERDPHRGLPFGAA